MMPSAGSARAGGGVGVRRGLGNTMGGWLVPVRDVGMGDGLCFGGVAALEGGNSTAICLGRGGWYVSMR